MIYDATTPCSVTVYFDAIRRGRDFFLGYFGGLGRGQILHLGQQQFLSSMVSHCGHFTVGTPLSASFSDLSLYAAGFQLARHT